MGSSVCFGFSGMVWCAFVYCVLLWYGLIWCGVVWLGVVWYDLVLFTAFSCGYEILYLVVVFSGMVCHDVV